MADSNSIEVEGRVIAVLPGTMFKVQLANEHVVLAHISGKLRKNFIKIAAGDMVKMEMSPYDLDKARITYRIREQNAPPPPSGTTAPAVPDRARRVDEFLEESFGRVRTARTSAGAELRGWSAGAAAAEGVDVGRRRFPGRRAIGPA